MAPCCVGSTGSPPAARGWFPSSPWRCPPAAGIGTPTRQTSARCRIGDKIKNLSFDKALLDPATYCKSAKDLDLAQAEGLRPLSLDGIRKGSPLCPNRKKQFLWLIASAGW